MVIFCRTNFLNKVVYEKLKKQGLRDALLLIVLSFLFLFGLEFCLDSLRNISRSKPDNDYALSARCMQAFLNKKVVH